MSDIRDSKKLLADTEAFLKGKKELSKDNLEHYRDILRFHEWRYYVQNNPAISDPEYDKLFKQLQKFEEKHPDEVTPDSPTQRVGSDLTKDFPEVEHLKPMLSLDNSYSEEDLHAWDKRVRGFVKAQEVVYSVEPKFDGGSIALVYEDDILVRGATRGNGTVGEEVTNNVKVINTIPLKARFSTHKAYRVEVRGEIMINKKKFKQINERRMEEGETILANPRNAAAGALRMQDPKEVAKRGLEAYLYQVGVVQNKDGNDIISEVFTSHHDSIQALDKLGFNSPKEEIKLCKSMDEVIKYCQEWEAKRDDYPYEIDGMVIKVDDFEQQEQCGYTSHHPRWAMAFKFKARQGTTKLLNIEYQVGRTGAVTPVAKLEPVGIGGVTVSSVSLFNEDIVKEKDLRIGDTVLVERAGDVIPYIVKAVEDARTGDEKPIYFPRTCPSCDSDLVKPEGEAVWRCVNIQCPAQAVERIIHFVSKHALDVDGLGEKQVRRFYEKDGFIQSIPDIFRLPYDKIQELDGFGKKSVENLEKSLEDSKDRSLDRLVFGLGIRYVGQTTAKTLAKEVEHLLDFRDWDQEKLLELPDIGPKVAESVHEFFQTDENIEMLKELEDLGVNLKSTGKLEPESHKLEGKTFLATGSLEKLTRDEVKDAVEANGGKYLSSVSKNLNYLVVGENAGSKLDKAKSIGTVEIIGEEDFLKMIE